MYTYKCVWLPALSVRAHLLITLVLFVNYEIRPMIGKKYFNHVLVMNKCFYINHEFPFSLKIKYIY